jgi:hypothetical protein
MGTARFRPIPHFFPSAKPKFTRRRFIEGELARHPLGGLKDSACPPSVWRVNPV